MGRLATLVQLIRSNRRSELRAALERSLLPAAVFRRNRMLVVRLVSVKPLPRPLESVVVRWGTASDEPLLQALRPRREGYGHHFRNGALLVVGELAGQPASCSWIEPVSPHRSASNGYAFEFGPGAGWVFGMEVLPRFRHAGVFHKHWAELLRIGPERGLARFYGAVQADNEASVKAHLRLGFEELWDVRLLRVAGTTRYAAQPKGPLAGRSVERGFGPWRGRDVTE